MDEFDEEISECLRLLFLNEETFTISDFFTTTKDNPGIIVNNYMYSLKYTGKNGDKRWVCLENKCNDSVTTKDEQIIKINGKSTTINKVLKHQLATLIPNLKCLISFIQNNISFDI